MNDRILHTPEGVRDIYGSECAYRRHLESGLMDKLKIYGFDPIQTPTFEYFDVFSEERGTVKAKDMYKFFDREGNTLVLRPDITPSIGRCYARYFSNSDKPVRLCYQGSTFTNSSEHQGKPKEVTQIGAELVGDSSVVADAEMIALTVDCLLAAGLNEFQVEIGNVQFFKAIVEEAGIDSEDIRELKNLINDKNSFGLEAFLRKYSLDDKLNSIFSSLPVMFGPFEKLSAFKSMTNNSEAVAAIERLEDIYELMKLYGYERYISFDLGMLSKYGYYTGIIFNAYTYGVGEPMISGGRYDRLMGQFGADAPAIGMGIVADRLMDALSRQNIGLFSEDKVRVFTADAAGAKEELQKVIAARRAGICAEIIVR